MTAPRSKRKEILETMLKVDSDAVVKMKTAVRIAVRKGLLDKEDAEDFYEFCGSWFDEWTKSIELLNIYEKIAIVRFANLAKP